MLAATEPVLRAYQDYVRARDGEASTVDAKPVHPTPGTRDTYLQSVSLEGDCHDGRIRTGGTLKVRVTARVSSSAHHDGIHVGILLVRNDGVWCYGISTGMDDLDARLYPIRDDEYGITLVFDSLPLLSGEYSFTVALMDARSPHLYDSWTGVAPLTVRHDGRDVGVARLAHRWERP
jgi:lipopolysaccharide transport system ATP-binding protein